MERVYLDNNATTPPAPEVVELMTTIQLTVFGNPSSGHYFGEKARQVLEEARQKVAGLLNADPSCIVFVSGGSEANNLAIASAAMSDPHRRHIVSSRVEHASVLDALRTLAGFGYEVDLLSVDEEGGLDLAELERLIRPDTCLVSLMGANNETGVVWDLEAVGRICRERGVLFHSDAVQLAGKLPVDVARIQVDYLSLAAHKLHGPKGIGALYVRRGAPVTKMIRGADQEHGWRAGTENVPAAAGFGLASELAARSLGELSSRVALLRERIEAAIRENIPDSRINGEKSARLPNTVNVSFAGCSSARLIQDLDELGFAVSAHSACQSGDLEPSHVLVAMGVPESYLHGSLRISLSRQTTEREVDRFLAVLPRVVAASRATYVD